jgi:DNA polymerase I-like protein with 3'-5' exonuclease and polymerase domains/5'-3' exonuclease
MKRLLIDLSSVCWTSLFTGQDKEFGVTLQKDGKEVLVNSAKHGYENAISMILAAARHANVAPQNFIIVEEHGKTTELRRGYFKGYKSKSGNKLKEQFDQKVLLDQKVKDALLAVGACCVTQVEMEADDVIAYLAQHLQGEVTIVSNDGDLAVLLSDRVSMWKGGQLVESNPFGPFDSKYITLYKALVGDPSDTYPGARGFGDKAFLNLALTFGNPGLDMFVDLFRQEEAFYRKHGRIGGETLAKLREDLAEFPPLKMVLDHIPEVIQCWQVARLYPELVNTLKNPLLWTLGRVKRGHFDERLRPFTHQARIVTTDKYAEACAFLRSQIATTEEFCLDLETTTPHASDEWLDARGSKGVDVIGSTITGCGVSFGNNNQYALYLSVNHQDTGNIEIDQLADFLALIPQDKLTIAHNAAGFELPVMYSAFGDLWQGNGWRGFFPNMVDSQIAASYWDENQPSHGLKALSKLLLGYDQETYDQVTTIDGVKYKMHELSAQHVVSYGLDDVTCTMALWGHFRRVMELEDSFDAFLRLEQKPMYLTALAFVQGTPVSLERLLELKVQDDLTYAECEKTLNDVLLRNGWLGMRCPVIEELTPASIKEAVRIILGQELKTQVRTVAKLAKLVGVMEHEDAPLLAQFLETGDLPQINDWMVRRFVPEVDLNVGSNKQMTELLYEKMGLPIRLRNKPTQLMRQAGKDGNPRADDEAMSMAIQRGDAKGDQVDLLNALITMKSINTKRGLYWNAYPDMLHWKTRRLHPQFRQSSTNTRRFTCNTPNLQQLDATPGGVRSVILPHHRNAVVVSLDESGQEVRLMAEHSGDANLTSCFVGENLKDTHSITAAMIEKVSYEEFIARKTSDDPAIAEAAGMSRQYGKTVFFATGYGSMAPKIAETLGVTESQAQGFIDALKKAFPQLFVWKDKNEDLARSQGWVPILGGTRRHLASLIGDQASYEYMKALRQASNARIQGAGGNQLKTIMSDLWDSSIIERYDYRWYFSVHDETVHSVGKGDAAACIRELHELMTRPFMPRIPSCSSIGLGRTFGTLVELGETYDAGRIGETLAELFPTPVAALEAVAV